MYDLFTKVKIDEYPIMNGYEQRIWRHRVYNIIFIYWLQLQKDEVFMGSIRDVCEIVLQEMETLEEYECCQGIRDMMYEYSDKLG